MNTILPCDDVDDNVSLWDGHRYVFEVMDNRFII